MEGTCLLAMRCPGLRQRESNPGFCAELENLVGSVKGKGPSGSTARPKVPMRHPGADCSVVPLKRSNGRGGREQVTCIRIVRVNGQPEELDGSDGEAAAFNVWHEPCESSGSSTDL